MEVSFYQLNVARNAHAAGVVVRRRTIIMPSTFQRDIRGQRPRSDAMGETLLR